MIAVVADPHRWHGKKVRLNGAFQWQFEGTKLCVHMDDLVYGMGRNCLFVHMQPEDVNSTFEKLLANTRKYVLLEARIDAGDRGHLGMSAGSLVEVTRLDVLEPTDAAWN